MTLFLSHNIRPARPALEKTLPAGETAFIADLIARDRPDASISPELVAGMNRFSRVVGILKGDPEYSDIVATQFSDLWSPASGC